MRLDPNANPASRLPEFFIVGADAVKMIVYKGFGHGIDKPKQQRAVMEHNYEWFSQWIWGETPPSVPSGASSDSAK